MNEYLSSDLDMTMAALKAHPKIYWIWNHRCWCLERVPQGPGSEAEPDAQGWRQTNWDRELFVVEKMLDADARNCACPPSLLLTSVADGSQQFTHGTIAATY